MNRTRIFFCCALALAAPSLRAEYEVCRPEFEPRYSGAESGEFTLDYKSAMESARKSGKCTILLVSGAWWCPHCHALDRLVLSGANWRRFVNENGFYLALMDFPYRGDVSAAETGKSVHPEMGRGWGFTCWYMDDGFLSRNGLSVTDGLKLIQSQYEYQRQLATPTAQPYTIRNWDDTEDFTYGKVGYPTLIVFGPEGDELGRFSFSMRGEYTDTPEHAQEYVISSVRALVNDAPCELFEEVVGAPDASVAEKVGGYLQTSDGRLAGTFSLRRQKANRKTGMMKLTASIAVAGEPKVSLSGSCGPDGVGRLAKRRSPMIADVRLGANGLSGVLGDGAETYKLIGVRNVFAAKDAASKALAAQAPVGTWGVALKPDASGSAFARGYGALSVKLAKKGSARITGCLGDGTRVSQTAAVLMGEGGVSCLPVVIQRYAGKKGGVRFLMWFSSGRLTKITDVSPWVAPGKQAFSVGVLPIFKATPGAGEVPEEMELMAGDFTCDTTLRGLPVVETPDGDEVQTGNGKRWVGTGMTKFTATYKPDTGLLRGSIAILTVRENGRTAKVVGTVNGVCVGGTAYCSMVVKTDGSWAVKIAECSGCED